MPCYETDKKKCRTYNLEPIVIIKRQCFQTENILLSNDIRLKAYILSEFHLNDNNDLS